MRITNYKKCKIAEVYNKSLINCEDLHEFVQLYKIIVLSLNQ